MQVIMNTYNGVDSLKANISMYVDDHAFVIKMVVNGCRSSYLSRSVNMPIEKVRLLITGSDASGFNHCV